MTTRYIKKQNLNLFSGDTCINIKIKQCINLNTTNFWNFYCFKLVKATGGSKMIVVFINYMRRVSPVALCYCLIYIYTCKNALFKSESWFWAMGAIKYEQEWHFIIIITVLNLLHFRNYSTIRKYVCMCFDEWTTICIALKIFKWNFIQLRAQQAHILFFSVLHDIANTLSFVP